MKRFAWRLQRVLDIKVKQEELARMELLGLTERVAEVRQRLLMRQAALRSILAELAKKNASKRLSEQELFLKNCGHYDEEIKKLKSRLSKLESQRRAKVNEVLRLRRFRKGLEKLRADARKQFTIQQEKLEQKELDESTSISFARKIIDRAGRYGSTLRIRRRLL